LLLAPFILSAAGGLFSVLFCAACHVPDSQPGGWDEDLAAGHWSIRDVTMASSTARNWFWILHNLAGETQKGW
jgi:hypothetical protein